MIERSDKRELGVFYKIVENWNENKLLQEATWLAKILGFIFWYLVLNALGSSINVLPIIVMISLAATFAVGELGWYPFEDRHQVAHKWSYLIYIIAVILTGSFLLQNPAPDWYPTNHSAWIVLPVFIYFIASVLRGFKWRERQ